MKSDVAMSFDADVKALLGAKFYDKLLNAVDTAKIKVKDAQMFAFMMKPEVGGTFQHARDEVNFHFDIGAFKKILSDSYRRANKEEREGLADRIIEILGHSDIGLNAVAVDLESAKNPQTKVDEADKRKEERKKAWVKACQEGDLVRVNELILEEESGHPGKRLLNEKVTVEGTADSTPMAIAALNGRTELVDLLVEHGADLSKVSSWTPMEMAIIGGHHDTAKRLKDHGVDPRKELYRGIEAYRRNAAYRMQEGLLVNYMDRDKKFMEDLSLEQDEATPWKTHWPKPNNFPSGP